MEEQGDGQYNKERGEDGAQCQGQSSGESLELITDEDGKVHGKYTRDGLGYRQQVDEVFLAEPFFLVDYFFLDEGNHGIATTDGEQAYLKEGSECFEIKIHTSCDCFM